MTLPVLMIGVLIAMGVFAALGWSVARVFRLTGPARAGHLAHAALILAGMAMISAGWPLPARVIGAALVLAALWAATIEEGWSKLFPLIGAAFGAALLGGLPFAGG